MDRNQITVVLDNSEDAECVASFLADVAQAGVKVTFLLRAKTRRAVWMQARMTALAAQHTAAATVLDQRWQSDIDAEQRAAEQQLSPLRTNLLRKGVESEVRLYGGSLKKTLRRLGGKLAVLPLHRHWPGGRFGQAMLLYAEQSHAVPSSKFSLEFNGEELRAAAAADRADKL